jgi:hypothetical protein
MDHLVRLGGSKGLSTEIAGSQVTRLQVTRINPRALAVTARRPWMAGSGLGTFSTPMLRDVGGQQSRNVTST